MVQTDAVLHVCVHGTCQLEVIFSSTMLVIVNASW